MSVSLGAATFPEDAINARELVSRSDEALYEAKRTRNTSCSFSERNRRFPRSPINLVVVCTGAEAAGSGPITVTAMNVSFGGMLCLSQVPLLPGTQVEVTLDMEEVSFSYSRIAWTNTTGNIEYSQIVRG